MNEEDEKDYYSLDELIDTLINIKNDGEGNLNIPKAIYCLAKEIEEITFYLTCLHQILPKNIKKFNPEPDENPFFSDAEFKIPTGAERERLINLMKNCKEKYDKDYPKLKT